MFNIVTILRHPGDIGGNNVRYDKQTALGLVRDMESFANEIDRIARDLCGKNLDSDWKDSKHREFCSNLSDVIKDIGNGSKTLRDYGEHLDRKIKELE